MSETVTPTYEINELKDFNQIPEDKIDACLKDFKVWLEFGKMMSEFETIMGIEGLIQRPTFIWIDDGKEGLRNIEIHLKVQPDDA